MPKMSGSELAWRLHLARPEVKILLMSGYTTNTITDYAVRDIGSTFLEKPFTLPSLAKKVRQVLDSLA
jgi:DNA-binding NtrC family response regulator